MENCISAQVQYTCTVQRSTTGPNTEQNTQIYWVGDTTLENSQKKRVKSWEISNNFERYFKKNADFE